MDERIIVYDGTQQCVIEKIRTPIGTKYFNICQTCTTRSYPQKCNRFFDCLANQKRPNAPFCHPWTHFLVRRGMAKGLCESHIEPTIGCDMRTGYKLDR